MGSNIAHVYKGIGWYLVGPAGCKGHVESNLCTEPSDTPEGSFIAQHRDRLIVGRLEDQRVSLTHLAEALGVAPPTSNESGARSGCCRDPVV